MPKKSEHFKAVEKILALPKKDRKGWRCDPRAWKEYQAEKKRREEIQKRIDEEKAKKKRP